MDIFKTEEWDRSNILNITYKASLPPAAKHGVNALTAALEKKGIRYSISARFDGTEGPTLLFDIADDLDKYDEFLSDNESDTLSYPESYCVKMTPGASPAKIIFLGGDARGLMYALLEGADRIESATEGRNPFHQIEDICEKPYLEARSLGVHLFNSDLEEEWYYSEDFWRGYLGMLARNRFNMFSLTFADHTFYLNPPYPYLVNLPQFPQIKARGLSPDDVKKNLDMLRFISDTAAEYGIDFVFSIWMHRSWRPELGELQVDGLPEYPRDYCAAGLREVLLACPNIKGVQYRMNHESGIPEDKQTDFFSAQFRAMRECGRDIWVDLRQKGLRESSVQAALDAGLEVVVSTKYWEEHMGLPYHPALQDKNYRHDTRYGFGDILRRPRSYKVMYRLWSVGSQRLLLWGDPQYASRFAKSCRFGDGVGFEVLAPLTNKGYGNNPGKWRIFADPSYESYDYEYERYWMYYLQFGRMGYNPETGPNVYRRELEHRFGEAAKYIEKCYRESGMIIPLITGTRMLSASEWWVWHELEPGYPLDSYARTQPCDSSQFYAIRSFKKTSDWKSDVWQDDILGYVEDTVAGKLRGKWTPIQVSHRLMELGGRTMEGVEDALNSLGESPSAELKATLLDMRILSGLAEYHAEKIMAATHLSFFEVTGESGRLPLALEHIKRAGEAWKGIVDLTKDVYNRKLIFGQDTRTLPHQGTHWEDFLDLVKGDIDYVDRLLKKHGGGEKDFKEYPGEVPLPPSPEVEAFSPKTVQNGEDIGIKIRTDDSQPVRKIILHYRPVNNKLDWHELDMEEKTAGEYEAIIPAQAALSPWDLMYYIEILSTEGGGWLWPSWEEGLPYNIVAIKDEIG